MKIIYSISRDNLVQWLMKKFVIIQSKNSFKVNKNWNNALKDLSIEAFWPKKTLVVSI